MKKTLYLLISIVFMISLSCSTLNLNLNQPADMKPTQTEITDLSTLQNAEQVETGMSAPHRVSI